MSRGVLRRIFGRSGAEKPPSYWQDDNFQMKWGVTTLFEQFVERFYLSHTNWYGNIAPIGISTVSKTGTAAAPACDMIYRMACRAAGLDCDVYVSLVVNRGWGTSLDPAIGIFSKNQSDGDGHFEKEKQPCEVPWLVVVISLNLIRHTRGGRLLRLMARSADRDRWYVINRTEEASIFRYDRSLSEQELPVGKSFFSAEDWTDPDWICTIK